MLMKSVLWSRPVGLVVGCAIAASMVPLTAVAAPDPLQPLQLAQTSIIGQCRAARLSTPIFSQRDPRSPVAKLMLTNDKVTLSENGATDGLIGVSAPTPGFIYAVNLKMCGDTTPPPSGSLCRRVIQPEGLIIRAQPNPNSAQVGSVGYLQEVTLTQNPPKRQDGPQGRIWIEIAKPAAGWVSNGFAGSGASNLGTCP